MNKISSDNIQIFIPTFNRHKSLKKTIESILNQDYKYPKYIEVIVLDNHSSDATEVEVLNLSKKYPNIKYIRNSINYGMIGNFNLISTLVCGKYFCVQTDDDIYTTNFISDSINLLETYKEANIAVLNAPTRVDGLLRGSQMDGWREGLYNRGEALDHVIKGKHPILTNCMFRRVIAPKFRFEPDLGGAADVYLLFKLLFEEIVVVSKKVGGYYDVHDESYTIVTNGVERLFMKWNLFLKIKSYSNQNGLADYSEVFRPKFFEVLIFLLIHSNYSQFKHGKNIIINNNIVFKYKKLILFSLSNRYIFNLIKILLGTLKKIKNV